MRNTYNIRLLAVVAVVLILISSVVAADGLPPEITVIYPKPDQVVTAIDSTFILGHLPTDIPCKPSEAVLFINGLRVPVHPDGGFLAFLPIVPGEFTFLLRAYRKEDIKNEGYMLEPAIAAGSLMVKVPEPQPKLRLDTLEIVGDFRPPPGDLVLMDGDMLDVSFRGTPGARAWFSIPGLVDSVPMAETPPRSQAYWGESVFGAGAVPDSLMIKGVYTGFVRIPGGTTLTSVPVVYHLAPPRKFDVMVSYLMDPTEENRARARVQWDLQGDISAQSRYRVTINPPDYPFTVRFTDSAQTIRYGPGKGYFAIFQPEGVEAEVIGAVGGWYRLRLSHSHFAWADSTLIERLPTGIRPPKSYVTSLRTYSWPNFVTVEIPLSGKHPFRVIEDDRRTLRLQLFGVTSNTDWIRYDFNDTLVDLATWSQPEDDLYELRLELNQDIWGFDTYYIGNTFNLVLNRPPSENPGKLKGKTIVVDPGHSTDPGAIGPTGYREADANLGIAMVLGRMLESKGARVVMTRTDGSDTPLYDRPAVAKIHNADLFISIHNNALPDGVNPFTNNGVSTYYYHPHSIDLARDIQREMVKATGLPDHGLYHGNLAVNRPTQYPAVLVECAFMIIPEQEAALKTYRFRKTVAEAILKGVERFLKEYDHGK